MPYWLRRLDSLTRPSSLFLGCMLILAIRPMISPIADPDFWWHLTNGVHLLALGHLLGSNPYTFTVPTHHWVMHEWLSEVVFASLYRLWNLGGIVIAMGIVTWLGLFFTLRRSLLDRPNLIILGTALFLASIAGYPVWGPRDQMFTFMFTALTLWILERHIRQGGRALWILIPVFLVWGNMHSAFIAGFIFGGAMLASEIVVKLGDRDDAISWKRIREIAVCLGLAAVVITFNPNGPFIIIYPLFTQFSTAQQRYIEEWQSPDFQNALVHFFEFLFVATLALVLTVRSVRLRDIALLLCVTAMCLQSVRHISFYLEVSLPILVRNADHLLTYLRTQLSREAASEPHATAPHLQQPAPRRHLRTLIPQAVMGILIYGIVAAVPVLGAVSSASITPASTFYMKKFPVCAADWLSSIPVPLRIFNQYGDGGYLIYRLSSRGDKVFIFGDAALMGNAMLYRYADIQDITPQWSSLIRGSGADVVLFERGTPLVNVLAKDSAWTEVYEDPKMAAFIPTAEYAALRPLLPQPPAPSSGAGACTAYLREHSA